VARKSSVGELHVCASWLVMENLIKTPLIYSVSCFNLGWLGAFFGRLSPKKAPLPETHEETSKERARTKIISC